MGSTLFADVDLSSVAGLDTVNHLGPSSIGIDTIYRSKGQIPEVFLRGAGVPEAFIANVKALVAAMEPIEFYSCFISYSSRDQEFAERLYADLQQKHVRCWFAPEDMKIGDRIRPRIDEAIRVHDKLLLVLTESSMKSAWVEEEVETAFERERKQERTVLFPIRLDDAVMEAQEAWVADIRRTRHIGDFCGWKDHDKYKRAFERLMRDLKAEK
ncbi:MAG TPA: toll/interleukin-1 receptor domain-containing protein [Candidatus Acidoferrum sp.]|nr:toll/interleukin-1 receptor domain-containing protein [Candidatus Acidoferrum sp.]